MSRKFLEYAGIIAGIVLIAFGTAAVVLGVDGRNTVKDTLAQEQIVGTPDMTPAAIKVEARKAGLPASIKLPTESVAGQKIDTGAKARAFASYMRIHTLEATGGYTYAQMGQFTARPGTPKAELAPGGGTSNDKFAVIDPKTHQPAPNAQRNIWVTETALSTALNTSYIGDRISLFGIVMGIALLLTGGGFVVLSAGGALRRRSSKDTDTA